MLILTIEYGILFSLEYLIDVDRHFSEFNLVFENVCLCILRNFTLIDTLNT